jgi:hypothetical protein
MAGVIIFLLLAQNWVDGVGVLIIQDDRAEQ